MHFSRCIQRITATDRTSSALLVARLTLGIGIFAHGGQKLFGLFGGQGFAATMHMFTDMLHIPAWLAVIAILVEGISSLALILGAGVRKNAFLIAVLLITAVALVHWQYGFYANWMGDQAGEGFEYHFLAIGLALALMLGGAGRWSVDSWIADMCAKCEMKKGKK